jgi:hypothetical protein
MARGRFVSNAIMSDKKINGLSNDTSRLAFTWLITEADCEGRVHGDPAMVRSLLFPRRTDITVEQIESYINEWHQAEIVKWYRANGDLWIWFPSFDKYQIGLRKEREPDSQIPPFEDGEIMPMIDGKHPANIRQTSGTNEGKVSKGKGREVADKPRTPPQIESYRKSAHRYPNKSLYALICEHVKDDVDSLVLFEKIVTGWIAMGWNPANINGILEFVDRGEIPHRNGQNGNSQKQADSMRGYEKV